MTALWEIDALAAAADGRLDGVPARPIGGVSIDSRDLSPGDLFVALRVRRDGHDFVGKAFETGAAAALVAGSYSRKPGDGALIRVDDPLAALGRIGSAARTRTRAKIIAVTGSVGKTGTKEMLARCLAASGPTHASEKSYNNHWGVPLTLARMPAASRYGVIEIGMNHAGEIRPLTRLARPHVAIVTMVGPVHIEFFSSEEAIADAKAEVFEGLEPDGVAILNANNRHFARLAAAAKATGAARIIACGEAPDADARLVTMSADAEGSDVGATILGRDLRFRIGAPGAHYAQNAIAVLAAVAVVGADVAGAAAALAGISAPVGRGARGRYDLAGGPVLLIDESYNANPASVAAALAAMAATPRDEFPRRIAILGDMRELGQQSDVLHSALAPAIEAAGVDVLFAAGPHMAGLYAAVPPARRGAHAPEAAGLIDDVLAAVRAGDVVMVKGSLGSHMGPIVDALKSHLASAARGTLTSR